MIVELSRVKNVGLNIKPKVFLISERRLSSENVPNIQTERPKRRFL